MASEWQSLSIDQIKANGDRAIAIGPFGSRMKANTYVASGVPVIRGNNISDTRMFVNEFVYVPEEVADELRACNVFSGDLIFPHRGAIGQVGIIPATETPRFMLSTSLMKLTCNQEIVNPLFVFYFFRSAAGRHALLQNASTVGTPGIGQPLASLRSIRLPIPPLAEQRAIAHILGTLDDKIELNRRRNQILEAMAFALFKDWFVDFGPVRAKMEGRKPYLPTDLWQLFPDRLDDEGKPEGWDKKPLDKIADFLNGLALQKFPATDPNDSLPVIKIAELRNGISAKSDRASREVPSKYVIMDGDFLFSWSGSLLAKFWTKGEGALNQHLFKVTSERYPMWFVSHWVHHHLEEFQAIAASKATTMGHIQRGHLKAAMTFCPSDDMLERLGVVMAPLVAQSIHNELESRNLAQLRDTLLPKLISGELRIADSEMFIERLGI